MALNAHRDVIIIGGSAAGLSAGLVLARAQLNILIIDSGQPRNKPADHMHGFLTRDGISPAEFLVAGRAELLKYGAHIAAQKVTKVLQLGDGGFEVQMENGEIEIGRALLVATGLKDEIPMIPGVQDRWGSLVHHCPYCHGYEVLGQKIAIISGAIKEMSIKQAGLLRRYSDRVDFLTNGQELTASEARGLQSLGVRIVNLGVSHIIGDVGTLTGVAFVDGTSLECDAVFVAALTTPNDQILKSLDCQINTTTNSIEVNEVGQTSVPGVWAAGNVVNPFAQVITAAGAGSASAIAISGWLLKEDLKNNSLNALPTERQ